MKINLKVIERRKLYLGISAVMVIVSLVSLFAIKLNLGVDFKGGELIKLKYDKKIDKKLQKIYDLKSGKIQIINVNQYIQRILLLILFYISLFNLSLNLKVYNHFIHVLVMIFIILSSLSVLITFIIKKKIFDAYYFNFNLKKLIPIVIFFVGIGYFLNSYKNTLEALNNKSILIRGAEMDSISELKNSTLEISNKEGKIKWKVDKNLKIITHEE